MIPGLHATTFPILDLQGRAVLVATVLTSESAVNSSMEAVNELGRICRQISIKLGW